MTTTSIPRKVDDNSPEMQFWNITCQVMALSTAVFQTNAIRSVAACGVFCGMGEYWRVSQAVSHAALCNTNLLVAGTNSREQTANSHDEYVSKRIETCRLDAATAGREGIQAVRILPSSLQLNTLVQARWVVEQVEDLEIVSMALFVSPYHLPRAYATLLKQMLLAGLRFAILPVAVTVPPSVKVPESGATAWESGSGEVERYKVYVAKGDLATQADFEEYFSWLYSQPILEGLV